MKPSAPAWLDRELAAWEAEGLIAPDQVRNIRARYSAPAAAAEVPVPSVEVPDAAVPGKPWGVLLFGGFGAVLLGLGVILLFAYNWHAIPKAGKLTLVFGALAAAHAGGLRLFLNSPRFKAVGEALCLLGSMLFGAGIWLVAQIYHISEHYPNAFIWWAAGALALAWAMPSIPQALLAAVLLAAWAGCEGIQFSSPEHLAPLLIVIGCGVLAWRERSRLLLAVSLAAFSLSLIFVLSTATGYGGDAARLVFATLFNLGAALIAAGALARAGRLGRFAESASVLAFFGWLPVLVIGYLFSFRELGHELFRHHQGVTSLAAWGYLLPVFVANLGLWGWALAAGRRAAGPGIADSAGAGRRPGWELVLLPLAGLYFVLAGGAGWVFPGPAILFTVGIFNLILLAVAAMSMLRGCRTGNGRQALAGSVLFLALVVARYFDLFHSQFTRGVVFLAVGALFTVEAVAYARQRAVKTQ
ncbi:MAG: DUF2157 domain-containing protein [Lentisphaeria bacterium]